MKVMTAGWIEAIRNLWTQDAQIDVAALEAQWRLLPLEIGGGPRLNQTAQPSGRPRLLCCLTGFDDGM